VWQRSALLPGREPLVAAHEGSSHAQSAQHCPRSRIRCRVVESGGPRGAHLIGSELPCCRIAIARRARTAGKEGTTCAPNMIHYGHGAGWGRMAYYPVEWQSIALCGLRSATSCLSMCRRTRLPLLDGLGVSLHAVRTAGFLPGKDVAVIGCGPIGLGIAAIAAAWGARDLFCVECL